jgi:hypothetical protein
MIFPRRSVLILTRQNTIRSEKVVNPLLTFANPPSLSKSIFLSGHRQLRVVLTMPTAHSATAPGVAIGERARPRAAAHRRVLGDSVQNRNLTVILTVASPVKPLAKQMFIRAEAEAPRVSR